MSPRQIGFLVSTALLCACTANYTRELTQSVLQDTHSLEHQAIKRENAWVLPQSAKIYIAYPSNNTPDALRPLNRTQYRFAEQLKTHFTRYFPASYSVFEEQSLAAALREANRQNRDFLLFPKLSAISHNPMAAHADQDPQADKKASLEFQLELYDVASRHLVDTTQITSAQGWLEFGKQEPTELLDKAVERTAKQLAGYAE